MIKKIVIAGGGTAGWMAAAALSKLLGKQLEICLIASKDIGTVGVGEATIPTLNAFHQLLDINQAEFLKAVQGTFKLGIRFENWSTENSCYIHAFGNTRADSWAAGFQHYWLKSREQGDATDYGSYSIEGLAARSGKFSLHAQAANSTFSSHLVYAWHFDAGLYASFLEKFSTPYGVVHKEGTIAAVNLHPQSGNITSLQLTSGEIIEGDLFIDCTGFKGLLIEQALHVGYEDWSHWLPCDSAVAVQTTSVDEPRPYTRSIARTAGWQWQIPLQHRVGNGLVYCRRYLDDEAAWQQLQSSLQGTVLTDPRWLRFRTGQRRQHWYKNCIALGLSSGFLEPLESTSIHFVQKNIIRLIQMFPHAGISQTLTDMFNEQSSAEMESVRDFIILHYHATTREDSPFWRYCRSMEIPDSLKKRLVLFKETGRFYRDSYDLFAENSWTQVLLGQDIIPADYHPLVNLMSDHERRNFISDVRKNAELLVQALPSHQQFIDRYCKAEAPG